MDQAKILKMAQEISDANGVSGFEDAVLDVVRRYGAPYGEMSENSLRDLFLKRRGNKGNRPVVQLDAHTDEVGFMVQAVKPNGTLRFITLGGWVANNIPAHRVRVRNADGDYIPGIIATKPPHFMTAEERKKPAEVTEMVIDIGSASKEETIRDYKIRVGAPVVPDVDFQYLEKSGLMIGKAFDCRLGCVSILSTLEELRGEELDVDLVAGFASQEEVGLRGAEVTARTIHPDAAIVFEGSPADDTFTEDYMIQTAIRRGPMLRHIDNRMITNPRMLRFALDLAEKNHIPVQEAVRTGGSTNGGPIHLSNGSVPVIVVGLPVRYIHSHYGIAARTDVENAVKLACAVIRGLNAEVIGSF